MRSMKSIDGDLEIKDSYCEQYPSSNRLGKNEIRYHEFWPYLYNNYLCLTLILQ